MLKPFLSDTDESTPVLPRCPSEAILARVDLDKPEASESGALGHARARLPAHSLSDEGYARKAGKK